MKKTLRINCTLLEWSEQQQVFHSNPITDGIVHIPPETNGYTTVYIADTPEEAYFIAEYIRKFIKRETANSDGISLTTTQVKRHIKAVLKLIKDYNRLLFTNLV